MWEAALEVGDIGTLDSAPRQPWHPGLEPATPRSTSSFLFLFPPLCQPACQSCAKLTLVPVPCRTNLPLGCLSPCDTMSFHCHSLQCVPTSASCKGPVVTSLLLVHGHTMGTEHRCGVGKQVPTVPPLLTRTHS